MAQVEEHSIECLELLEHLGVLNVKFDTGFKKQLRENLAAKKLSEVEIEARIRKRIGDSLRNSQRRDRPRGPVSAGMTFTTDC